MARVGREAFTLIELLMVVLVVGILASVAVPVYSAQKRSAQDADAFQRLEIALRHGAAQFTLNEQFPAQASLVAALAAVEPHLGAQEGPGWPAGGVAVTASPLRAEYHAASRSGGRVAIRDERDPAEGGPKTIRWRATPDDVAGGPVVNEVSNPSFESGALTPWTRWCNAGATCTAPELVDEPDGHGRWALSLSAIGGVPSAQSYMTWSPSNTHTTATAVSAGDRVFVRARVRVTRGACVLRSTLRRWDESGIDLAVGYFGVIDTDPPVGEWQTLAGTHVVAAGVGFVTVRLVCDTIPDGVPVTVQTDHVMLVVNPPAANPRPSYVDGDSPGGTWLAGGRATGRSQGVPIEPLTTG